MIVRWWVVAVVVLGTGCSPGDAPGCVRNGDCPQGAACRGGACLRYVLPPGTPVDPLDAAVHDAATDTAPGTVDAGSDATITEG